jgi:hypothetical protein
MPASASELPQDALRSVGWKTATSAKATKMEVAMKSSLDCAQVKGQSAAKSPQQIARENRIFAREKSYQPGALAAKRPVTDALRFLVKEGDALRIAHCPCSKSESRFS